MGKKTHSDTSSSSASGAADGGPTRAKRRNTVVQGEKLRGAQKVARIPIKVIPTEELPKKPDWIRVKMPV